MGQQKLPDPIWSKYFAISYGKIVLAFSEKELLEKANEFKFTKNMLMGKSGNLGTTTVYEILQGKLTPKRKGVYEKYVGKWPIHNFSEIQEKGLKHPVFLPNSGCFGFINGNLILGNRHHQEVMYRLISEKGWTWDQLINAEQCWGWYSAGISSGSVRFSSDAGTMTSKKVKEACRKTFEEWYGKTFKETPGYGGKSKANYGGNMEMKYGKPGAWKPGTYTNAKNSIISPLPDPPKED